MTLIVRDTGDREPVPAGTHPATCVLIADVGVQPGGRYAPKHKVYIGWELDGVPQSWRSADGTEHSSQAMIGRFYTASLSEKAALRAMLENWRSRSFTAAELEGFDLAAILGKPCLVSVQHSQGADGKTYADVAAITSLPRGMPMPKSERPHLLYSPDSPEHFDQLPPWLQQRIEQQPATTSTSPGPGGADFPDDDIPF